MPTTPTGASLWVMQHLRGPYITLVTRTQVQGAPSAVGDGTATTTLKRQIPNTPGSYHKRLWIRVVVAGAGTCQLTLWASDSVVVGNNWGIPTDASGNLALLGNGTNFSAGTYFFVFEDVAHCSELVIVQSGNAGGTPTTAAKVCALVEKQESQ